LLGEHVNDKKTKLFYDKLLVVLLLGMEILQMTLCLNQLETFCDAFAHHALPVVQFVRLEAVGTTISKKLDACLSIEQTVKSGTSS
jgi:hypothetical protein